VHTKTIHVEPGSELDSLLDAASAMLVELERSGVQYRMTVVQVDEDIWAGYDPKALRAAVRETAGSWRRIDPEVLMADMYRAGEEGTRPLDR
jgi:hypothetical protein